MANLSCLVHRLVCGSRARTRRLLAWLEEKRIAFAEEYARRPKLATPAELVEPVSKDKPDEIFENEELPEAAHTVEAPLSSLPVPAQVAARSRPQAEPLRPLGDFDRFQTSKGRLYEIWIGERLGGEVEVLSRATSAPRLHGHQAVIGRSEYEGFVEPTGERFKTNDLYAAVREVARRARLKFNEEQE